MHRTDVKSLTPFALRRILKGEAIILTHKDEDLCAVIPIELLTLLEGLQLESLEEEEDGGEEIASIIRSISKQD